ncbi:MAG: LytTR family DNA-binding domain-containing protein [Gemmatimonadota bacterium]
MNDQVRAVIVDDEPLARDLLRGMLESVVEVRVVGEAGDGAAAVELVRGERPELLFLDVQMPERDGFDVLRELGEDAPPAVIFVTAYDRYALRAFEVSAMDYLLKPFDEERLERSVSRAVAELRGAASGKGEDRVGELLRRLELLERRERYSGRLAITQGERTFLQPVRDIDWIEADGKFMNIHVGEKKYTMRATLLGLQEQLDPEVFLRVSRGAILNVNRIREVQPWFNGEYVAVMHSGAQVTTTRSYRAALARVIGKE